MKIKNFRKILLSLLLLLTTLLSMALPVLADQVSEIDEQEVYKTQIIERANTLYRQLAASHDTFNGYITYTQRTKDSYESSLRQASLYNAYKDDMIGYTEAFVDVFVSFLKADVEAMGESFVNKLADETTKGVLPKVTIDEFIYAQAWEGSQMVSISSLWDFKDIYEGSAEGFTSYDDAAQFIMTVQGNKLGMAALAMGKDLYMDQLNESPLSILGGIAKDLLVSQVLNYLPDVNWFVAYGGDYAYSTLLDGIITLATESDNPFIAQWKDDIENINQETRWLLRMDENDPALYPEHTVYFDPNGGSVSRASITVHETLPYGSMPVPYLFGYTFNGWFDAREGGHRYIGSSRYELQTDQQLYAHWSHTILAQGSCGDNLTWILYGDGILEISGNGAMTEAPWREEWSECIGKVIIANGVTSVCDSAFKDLPYLEEVILPSTLDSIGRYAFAGCIGLTDLSFLKVPTSLAIGECAFQGCTGITELTIPSTVEEIGSFAFSYCSGMEKLMLPQTAVYGNNAFKGCIGLKEVTMPIDLDNGQIFSNDIKSVETIHYLCGESGKMPDWDTRSTYSRLECYSRENLKHLYFEEGIEHIGTNAYRGNVYIFNDIRLPSTLKSIGNYAFYENSSLKSIEIPEGVTTIGDYAFSKSGLTEITIPESMTYIPRDCFEYCTALEEVTLPSSLTEIRSGAFVGCTSLTALPTIPDDASVRILGGAFQGCTGITELTIPSTVEEIGSFAFSYCSGMEKLMLPQTAVYGNNAFKGCIGLKEVTMPIDLDNGQIFSNDIKSVETIHYLCGESGKMPDWDTRSTYSRPECYSRENLKHLYFEEGIEHIGDHAYRGNVYIFTDIYLPSTLKSIGNYAFYENSSLKSIEIPEGVTTIGTYAFSKSGLTEVTIPESMTYIPSYCFEYCTALEEVILPSSLTEINQSAFAGCTALTTLPVIPDGASVRILSCAFSGCTGITELMIPSTVTEISDSAFASCSGMEKLTLPQTAVYGNNAFKGCTGLKEVTMPIDLDNGRIFSNDIKNVETIHYLCGESGKMPDLDSYHTLSRLEYYSRENLKHLYFEEGIEHIGDYAYSGSGYAFIDIHLPSTLKSIGNRAFYENSSLKSIEIPEGVTTIGAYAFSKSGLTEVTIPESMTYIPINCFEYCTALEEVTLPSSLTEIGHSAFAGCTALTKLPAIPDDASVRILSCAFSGCTGITELTIPSTVTEISDSAFAGCSGMEKLTLPQTAVYYNHVFYSCTGLKEVTMPVDMNSSKIFSDDIKNVETIHYLYGESGRMSNWNYNSTSRLEYWSRENLKHLYFEEGIEHIGDYAFYGSGYTFNDIHLPSTLKSIGNCAFCDNVSLTKIEIPDGVTSIGFEAFKGSGLTEVTIPENLEEISSGCFKYCAALRKVFTTHGSSLSYINSDAFNSCPEDLTFFGYSGGTAESYAIDSGYHFVALDVEWEAEMKLPAGLKTIEDEAFVNGSFQTVKIPDGIQTIGSRAFAGCENLERIIIPDSVETIAPDAFEGVDFLVVYCSAGSYAQQYAREHELVIVDD